MFKGENKDWLDYIMKMQVFLSKKGSDALDVNFETNLPAEETDVLDLLDEVYK